MVVTRVQSTMFSPAIVDSLSDVGIIVPVMVVVPKRCLFELENTQEENVGIVLSVYFSNIEQGNLHGTSQAIVQQS